MSDSISAVSGGGASFVVTFEGPSFAYSLTVHSFHTRRDRVASLTTCCLHGAAIQSASPLGTGRALTLPCGWNNAGQAYWGDRACVGGFWAKLLMPQTDDNADGQ